MICPLYQSIPTLYLESKSSQRKIETSLANVAHNFFGQKRPFLVFCQMFIIAR